jgi:hypothetical protein
MRCSRAPHNNGARCREQYANQRRLFVCFRPVFFAFADGFGATLLPPAGVATGLVALWSRTSGAAPGYQMVYIVRQRSSLSGVRTCTSFCHNFVTTASTSLPSTFVTTFSPTLNGFFTNPEFDLDSYDLANECGLILVTVVLTLYTLNHHFQKFELSGTRVVAQCDDLLGVPF